MSAQLILYPQDNNGYAFTTQSIFNEYVSQGNFSGGFLGTPFQTGSTKPIQAAMLNRLPTTSFRGFHTFATTTWGATSVPTITSAGLTLFGSTTSQLGSTGLYQLINGLTAGASYEITITTSSTMPSLNLLVIGNRFNTNWNATGGLSYSNLGGQSAQIKNNSHIVNGEIKHTFTALGSPTYEVLCLEWVGKNSNNFVITNISIKETQQSAPQIITDLADGQVICDLYEDEAIPLSLSIDDFKNVAEKVQSYSKDFHLPNTKRNNKIFGHIFDVQRTTTGYVFNPYLKTRAILKEDSYLLFEGFLQLIDINDKEGEVSYNVNLYSEPVTLKDVLQDKTFAGIDFTELQHDYTITNIKNSWDDSTGLDLAQNLTTSSAAYDSSIGLGNTNVLKYPFVNWRGDFSIDSSGNIGLIDLEQVFRPFIQVKYLLQRIIHEAGFEFHSNFFDTTDFKKLYMDFNWGQGLGSSEVFEMFETNNSGETLVRAGTSFTELEIGNVVSENPTGITGTYLSGNTLTATNNNTTVSINYTVRLYNSDSSSRSIDVEWQHHDASTGNTTSIDVLSHSSFAAGGFFTYQGYLTRVLDTNDTLKCVFKSDVANKFLQGNNTSVSIDGNNQLTIPSIFFYQLTSIQTAASSLLHSIRGEVNQYEFFKGIMTMFNLVVIKEDEILRIEPYSDIFINNSNSTQHNWTEKVDVSEINLKPLELKRMVKLRYEDDDNDYSLNVYKKATSGYLYGTKEIDGSTAVGNQISNLTGIEEIIATPFAPTLIKPATDFFDAELTIPHIYSGNDDGTEFEDFENLPRILYNVGVKTLPSKTYFVPAQNGAAAINSETQFLQFAHLSEIPTTTSTIDYNFESRQLIQAIGGSPIDNLYQTYYSPYYDELYNPDTRVMTMKVDLSPADIENFRFYDTVIIKNREYRVNKIEYKPNTLAKVEFILIP